MIPNAYREEEKRKILHAKEKTEPPGGKMLYATWTALLGLPVDTIRPGPRKLPYHNKKGRDENNFSPFA